MHCELAYACHMKHLVKTLIVAAAALITGAVPTQAFAADMGKTLAASRSPGSVSVTLTPGAGLSVDVTVDFESVTNLSLANTGISASVLGPVDLALLATRLPLGTVGIPTAFPVLVDITPPAGLTPLSFDGLATLTLRTENLPYYSGIRLRLFAAHGGGDFADITNEVSYGSYRVRGSNGDFSEFLIIQDDRSNADVIELKLSALEASLTSYSLIIDPTVYATLTAQLGDVRSHWDNNEPADAIVDLDAFTATIVASTPLQIPQTWVAPGGLVNANGILRSMASSLRFSLAANPCPASGNYTDTDADGIPDECDNCTLVSNPSQCDSNSDGYGNHCDADLNNNGVVNFLDLAILKSHWLSADPDSDINCNGVVNFIDLASMKSMWLAAPGPSGIAP